MTAVDGMTALLTDLYDSFGNGDATVWSSSFAPEALIIGSDEAEWCVGRDEIVALLGTQLIETSATGMRVTAGSPHIVADGHWVWAADRPVVQLADGTRLVARFTVLAKQDGDRLIIQHSHFSVGAPNEDTIKQHLTV